MALDREALHAALYARLTNATTFETMGREFKSWDDVPAGAQPAIFVVLGNQAPQPRLRGLPPVWEVNATVFVYCRNDAFPDQPSGMLLNDIVFQIDRALERTANEGGGGAFPDAGNQYETTLGGLCSHCWISGEVVTDEGRLSPQCVAVIPIQMLATG